MLNDNNISKNISKNVNIFKCDECTKEFIYLGNLKNHKVSSHGEKINRIATLVCQNCPAKFVNKKSLVAHSSLHHGSFSCGECSFTSSVQKELKKHAKSHVELEPEVIACTQCDQEFSDRKKLRDHKKNRHRNKISVSVVCPTCSSNFMSRDSFRKHDKKHHQ